MSLAGKQAHEHLVLQLNFPASLWCHWWELPVFTRTSPERLVSPGRLGLYWQSQVLSGGIKISIYQESTEAVWGAAGEMAHSGRLPAVGLWWRVQQAGMCPCRLFLDSMRDVKPSHPLAPVFHFVKSAVQASALFFNENHSLIPCLKETSKEQILRLILEHRRRMHKWLRGSAPLRPAPH